MPRPYEKSRQPSVHFTHPMSEIISGMCDNGIIVTGLQEFDYDISGGFSAIDQSGFPLSMIIQGRKIL